MPQPNILTATDIKGVGYGNQVAYWNGFGSLPSSAYISQNAVNSGKVYRVNNFTLISNEASNAGNTRYQLNTPIGAAQGLVGLSAGEIVRIITADSPFYVMEGQSILAYRTIASDIRFIISYDVITQ